MRKLLPVLLALLLTACGFQLRGSQPLPFSSLYIATGEGSEMGAALRRNIRAVGSTQLPATPQEAQAIFTVIGEAREKSILSSLAPAACANSSCATASPIACTT